MKSWCYTQILEYELVRKAAVGLDFSIRKKLGNLEVRDMVQLAERARRIKQIKYVKEGIKDLTKVEGRKLHIWNHIKVVIIL